MKRIHLLSFAASAGLLVAAVVMTALFWNQLPAQIPTHFNFAGTPDAWTSKNLITTFMVPLIHLGIFLLFVMLYRHPQYSSWPTTLILMTVDEEKREKIFAVLRGMMVATLFWISTLFAYIQFSVIATANGRSSGIMTQIMIGFLAVMFIVLVVYNAKIFITVRKLIKVKNRS